MSVSRIRKQSSLLGLITGLLLIAVFYYGKPVLMPLALAGLFSFLLNPVVNFLHRLRMPRALAVVIVTILVFSTIGGIGWVIGKEFSALAGSLDGYKENIQLRVESFRKTQRGGVIEKLEDIRETIKESNLAAEREPMKDAEGNPLLDKEGKPIFAPPDPPAVKKEKKTELPPTASKSGALPDSGKAGGSAMNIAGDVLGNVATVIVFTIFMLLRQQELRNRLMRLAGFRHVTTVTRAMDETSERVGRYLLMQALINGSYGVVLAIGLYFIGLPYVVFFGVLAALFRFIPYLGPVVVAVLPAALSLAFWQDWQHPLMVIGLIAVLELITNMVVEPVLYGQSVGVSEFALLVSIVFWTWLWGGIGLIMATPLTVCLVVMAQYVPSLEWVQILMGDDPKVKPWMVLYQRLLAEDETEAVDFIRDELKTKTPLAVVDGAVLPAIALARRELEQGRLTTEEEEKLHESVFRVLKATLPPAHAPDEETPPGEALLLGRPLEEGADEAALQCFDQLLPAGLQFEVIPVARLDGEFKEAVATRNPAAILLSATPPGSHTNVRLQLRRLRRDFPKLKIFVGRWGVPEDVANAAPLIEAGATAVFTSLTEAQESLESLIRAARAVTAVPAAPDFPAAPALSDTAPAGEVPA